MPSQPFKAHIETQGRLACPCAVPHGEPRRRIQSRRQLLSPPRSRRAAASKTPHIAPHTSTLRSTAAGGIRGGPNPKVAMTRLAMAPPTPCLPTPSYQHSQIGCNHAPTVRAAQAVVLHVHTGPVAHLNLGVFPSLHAKKPSSLPLADLSPSNPTSTSITSSWRGSSIRFRSGLRLRKVHPSDRAGSRFARLSQTGLVDK